MRIDHIGYAVKHIEKARAAFEELGFEGGGKAEYQRVADLIFSKVCELKYGTADADQGEKEN